MNWTVIITSIVFGGMVDVREVNGSLFTCEIVTDRNRFKACEIVECFGPEGEVVHDGKSPMHCSYREKK